MMSMASTLGSTMFVCLFVCFCLILLLEVGTVSLTPLTADMKIGLKNSMLIQNGLLIRLIIFSIQTFNSNVLTISFQFLLKSKANILGDVSFSPGTNKTYIFSAPHSYGALADANSCRRK